MDCQYLDFGRFGSNPSMYDGSTRRDLITNKNTLMKSIGPETVKVYDNYERTKQQFHINNNPAHNQVRGADLKTDNFDNQEIRSSCRIEHDARAENADFYYLADEVRRLKNKLELKELAEKEEQVNTIFLIFIIVVIAVVINLSMLNSLRSELNEKIDMLNIHKE